jgi:amidase
MDIVTRRRFLAAATTLAALSACRSAGIGAATAQSDAGWIDAVAQAKGVAEGRLRPLDLVNAAIARLDAVNPRINAVRLPNYDRARAVATNGVAGPLAGVPTLIKDNVREAGLPYTQGSRALAATIADKTDAYPAAIAAAGLVSIGRSTLPEFGLTATTEPVLTGATRNPWNLEHSTGGSSGGSAAAVAAGVVAVAHANDGGGSIRIPASKCGLVGLKPSRRRMAGHEASSDDVTNLAVEGCVSRSVRDTAAWFHATQATGPGVAFAPAPLVAGPAAERLRIGMRLEKPVGGLPDADVQRVFADTAALLGRLGHKVRDVPAAYQGRDFIKAFINLWEIGAAGAVADIIAALPGGTDPDTVLEPLTLGMAAAGRSYRPERQAEITATLSRTMQEYRAQFADIDVYVTPVLGLAPAQIGYIAPTIPWPEQRDRLIGYAGYTELENVAGVPSIALPIGQSAGGLPIGMQFAAAPGREALLLALAYEVERELRWDERKPAVWVGDMV